MSPPSEGDSPCLLPEPVITKAQGSAATEGGTAGSGGSGGSRGGQSRSGGGGALSSSLSKFGNIQLASDLFSEIGQIGGESERVSGGGTGGPFSKPQGGLCSGGGGLLSSSLSKFGNIQLASDLSSEKREGGEGDDGWGIVAGGGQEARGRGGEGPHEMRPVIRASAASDKEEIEKNGGKTAGGLGGGLADLRSISASLSKFGNIQLASDLFADADTGVDDTKESPVPV
jgi:hypothetical protein